VTRLDTDVQGFVQVMTIGGSTIFFAATKGIFAVPVSGGTPQKVNGLVDSPMDIAYQDGALFWLNRGPSGDGTLRRVVP
jgi:hypothetical protein